MVGVAWVALLDAEEEPEQNRAVNYVLERDLWGKLVGFATRDKVDSMKST